MVTGGLYGGLDQKAIHQRKGLKKESEDPRIIWVQQNWRLISFELPKQKKKLKRDGVNSKQQANTTHFDVGRKVRQTIQELGGTMPEELPTPQVSIKQLENSVKNYREEIAETKNSFLLIETPDA